jgi:hypothetical protein
MTLPGDYNTYDLSGNGREAAITEIRDVNAALGSRLGRESLRDYVAVQADNADEYMLITKGTLPESMGSVQALADVAFRRAENSEILTLGEKDVARGQFSDTEVRYLLVDGGSLWVIIFNSDRLDERLSVFDDAVATFRVAE